MLNLVVKRTGQDQKLDAKKLYASVYASLIASKVRHKEAELISEEVTKLTRRSIDNKSHVSSHSLRIEAAKHLRDYNNLAAYIYMHHRILS